MGPKEMARSCVRRGAGLGKEFAAECSGHGTGYPGHTLRDMVDGPVWSLELASMIFVGLFQHRVFYSSYVGALDNL